MYSKSQQINRNHIKIADSYNSCNFLFSMSCSCVTFCLACPAAVSVEVSRDGLPPVPVSAPVNTTGLTCIKVHLQRAEVVTSVTVRLHKPRDSTTIGLSQVILLGSTAFSEASSSHNSSNMLAAKVDFCRTR